MHVRIFYSFFGVIFVLIVSASIAICAPFQPSCDAIEIVEGNDRYNELLCSGLEHFNSKRYRDASNAFETALKEPLFEYPNYKLFSRLAVAYFRVGDISKASAALRKAELSLYVLMGSLNCIETDKGFDLTGGSAQVLKYKEKLEVVKVMCGAAYDYIYRQRTFIGVVRDAKLIEYHLAVTREIKSP